MTLISNKNWGVKNTFMCWTRLKTKTFSNCQATYQKELCLLFKNQAIFFSIELDFPLPLFILVHFWRTFPPPTLHDKRIFWITPSDNLILSSYLNFGQFGTWTLNNSMAYKKPCTNIITDFYLSYWIDLNNTSAKLGIFWAAIRYFGGIKLGSFEKWSTLYPKKFYAIPF